MKLRSDLEVLLRLGLTLSQGKVYVALLKLGKGTRATAIAKFADIPRQDVYRVLEELQKIGIVHKTFENPAGFWADPPQEVVQRLLRRKKKELSKLEEDGNKFAESIMETLNEISILPEIDSFILLLNKEKVLYAVSEAIEKSENLVKAFMTLNELESWLTILSEVYERANARGIKFQYITEKPPNISTLPKKVSSYIKNKTFEVRFVTNPLIAKAGIYDGKKIILALSKDGPFACSSLLSNNPSLIAIVDNYFQNSWEKALKPYE